MFSCHLSLCAVADELPQNPSTLVHSCSSNPQRYARLGWGARRKSRWREGERGQQRKAEHGFNADPERPALLEAGGYQEGAGRLRNQPGAARRPCCAPAPLRRGPVPVAASPADAHPLRPSPPFSPLTPPYLLPRVTRGYPCHVSRRCVPAHLCFPPCLLHTQTHPHTHVQLHVRMRGYTCTHLRRGGALWQQPSPERRRAGPESQPADSSHRCRPPETSAKALQAGNSRNESCGVVGAAPHESRSHRWRIKWGMRWRIRWRLRW